MILRKFSKESNKSQPMKRNGKLWKSCKDKRKQSLAPRTFLEVQAKIGKNTINYLFVRFKAPNYKKQ